MARRGSFSALAGSFQHMRLAELEESGGDLRGQGRSASLDSIPQSGEKRNWTEGEEVVRVKIVIDISISLSLRMECLVQLVQLIQAVGTVGTVSIGIIT